MLRNILPQDTTSFISDDHVILNPDPAKISVGLNPSIVDMLEKFLFVLPFVNQCRDKIDSRFNR